MSLKNTRTAIKQLETPGSQILETLEKFTPVFKKSMNK